MTDEPENHDGKLTWIICCSKKFNPCRG